jgi:hypothetical protein
VIGQRRKLVTLDVEPLTRVAAEARRRLEMARPAVRMSGDKNQVVWRRLGVCASCGGKGHYATKMQNNGPGMKEETEVGWWRRGKGDEVGEVAMGWDIEGFQSGLMHTSYYSAFCVSRT